MSGSNGFGCAGSAPAGRPRLPSVEEREVDAPVGFMLNGLRACSDRLGLCSDKLGLCSTAEATVRRRRRFFGGRRSVGVDAARAVTSAVGRAQRAETTLDAMELVGQIAEILMLALDNEVEEQEVDEPVGLCSGGLGLCSGGLGLCSDELGLCSDGLVLLWRTGSML